MGLGSARAIWSAESFGCELIDTTVGDLLDRQAATRPDKEALVYRYPEIGLELRMTYAQLRDEANRVAKGLMATGVGAGDKVAVLATKRSRHHGLVQLASVALDQYLPRRRLVSKRRGVVDHHGQRLEVGRAEHRCRS